MPAKDTFHDAVKNALEKDGWNVKADPLHLKWGKRDFYVDLAASRFYLADKGERHIAVEVKSFTGESAMSALEQGLGQYLIYRSILKRKDPLSKVVSGNQSENVSERLSERCRAVGGRGL
jgi:hypothetical protein